MTFAFQICLALMNRVLNTVLSSRLEIVDTAQQVQRHLSDSHTASPIATCTVYRMLLITQFCLICCL